MKEIIIKLGPFIAYIFMSCGIIKQIIKIRGKRKADQIAWLDVLLRLMATIIFLFIFVLMKSTWLLVGNIIFLVLSLYYIKLLFKYRIKKQ